MTNGENDFGAVHAFEAMGNLSRAERTAKVKCLTDEQLTSFYNAVHHPDIIDETWTPLLEAELRARGLLIKH